MFSMMRYLQLLNVVSRGKMLFNYCPTTRVESFVAEILETFDVWKSEES